MPIENRNLQPLTTRLVGRYHKQPYICEVLEGDGGKLRYRLEDGREFKSPSAAGMAITGHACDGWVFWSVEKTETVPAPDAKQTEAATDLPTKSALTAEESVTTKKGFFRTPNQKGVPTGQTRWYCHHCGKSFLAATGQMPKTCPAGHQSS